MLDKVADRPQAQSTHDVTHFDVLIAGAGISGIGSAVHLKAQCPEKSFVLLDSKDTFGGTWETHKYPGVRSDSDLYTFGYRFKPWIGPPIAAAEEILKYMGDGLLAVFPIDEYVDRLYPDAGDAFKRTQTKAVGRKVRRVRALLFTIHNAI